MLAHFRHPAVWVSYGIVVLVCLLGFEYFHKPLLLFLLVVVVLSGVLVGVDYYVHSSVHKGMFLRYPSRSILWVGILGAVLPTGLIVSGWQLAGIYICQAVWDNSWHAAFHHHEDGGPQAELDHPLVRWGVAMLALAFVAIPRLL